MGAERLETTASSRGKVKILRAMNEKTKTDLSDHHPCEWEISGLKGLTYNVQFLPRLFAKATGKTDKKEIEASAKLIANWMVKDKYDVLCLQELFDPVATESMETELERLGYNKTNSVGGGAILGSSTSGGVRTFVRHDLKMEDKNGHIYQHKVDKIGRGDASTDKGIKYVKITKNGVHHHVFNTHAQASYNDPSHQHYVEVALAQQIELAQYIVDLKKNGDIKEGDNIVVCGDFNIPKNATGKDLDAVSKRGQLLFNRSQILLGPKYHIIEPSKPDAGEPSASFDPETNTYLAEAKETMRANLDLVFSVDAAQQDDNSALHPLIRDMQIELSLFVQNHVLGWGFCWLSEEERQLISTTSTAIDNFIEQYRKPFVPLIPTAYEPLLTFSQSLSEEEQINIESKLTLAILAHEIPVLCTKSPSDDDSTTNDAHSTPISRIQRCLNPDMLNKLHATDKKVMREAMKSLRNEETRDKMGSIETHVVKLLESIKNEPQINIESTVTIAMLERKFPNLCASSPIIRSLNPDSLNKLHPQDKTVMREAMACLRNELLNNSCLEFTDIEKYLDKMAYKIAVEHALHAFACQTEKLKGRMSHHNENAFHAASALCASLKNAVYDHFQINGTDSTAFENSCETAINKHMPELEGHCGIWWRETIASFLIAVGKALGFPSWEEKGKSILQSESLKTIGLFKQSASFMSPESRDREDMHTNTEGGPIGPSRPRQGY